MIEKCVIAPVHSMKAYRGSSSVAQNVDWSRLRLWALCWFLLPEIQWCMIIEWNCKYCSITP